jgi:O-antigen/teichoic acid export membrane protein
VPADPQQKITRGNTPPLNPTTDGDVAAADILLEQPLATAPANRYRQLVSLLPMTILWALIAQGVLSVTRLLTTMTVGGKFGSGNETQLGYYSNAFAALMILIALFEAFVTTPLTVFNQKQTQNQRALFAGHMLSIGLLLIGLLAAVGGIITIAQLKLEFLKPELVPALLAVGAMAPFQLLREFSRRWLLANLEVKSSAFLEIVFAALFFIAVFALVSLDKVTAVSVLLTLAAINAIGLIGWWAVYRQRFRFKPEVGVDHDAPAQLSLPQQIGNNFRYGRWVAGENVCSTLTMYFCNWYLMYQLDERAAGVFFACFTVVMLANPFLLGISSVLAPKSAKAFNDAGYPGLLKTLLKFGSVLMVVMMLFSVLLWFAGDRLTMLLFPADYKTYFAEHLGGKNQVVGVLGLALPAMGMSYIAAFGLLAAHRPHDNFVSAVVGVIVLIVANLMFAETTLMTAAISFITSFFAAMICRVICLVMAFMTGDLKPITQEN